MPNGEIFLANRTEESGGSEVLGTTLLKGEASIFVLCIPVCFHNIVNNLKKFFVISTFGTLDKIYQ